MSSPFSYLLLLLSSLPLATSSSEKLAEDMKLRARNMPIAYQVCLLFPIPYNQRLQRNKAKPCEVDDNDDAVDIRGRSSFLWSGKGSGQHEQRVKVTKAGFYAVQVFYSFFIM